MVRFDNKKWEDILTFLIAVVIIILVNILSSRNFFRVDLTEDKRFSISEASKNLLRELDDVVYVEIYLDGNLPPPWVRMKNAIVETLEEFRVYSDFIQYRFVNPETAATANSRNEFIQNVALKGIQPLDIFLTEDGNRIRKRILPGVLVSYGVGEKGVQLFKGNSAVRPDEQLNQSIEGIEYELATAIYDLSKAEKKTIALIKGHGELDSLDIISFKGTLNQKYKVIDLVLSKIQKIADVDLVIIAKPTKPYTPLDKYKLDQYIMSGGSAMFLLDLLSVNMDSAGIGTIAFQIELNLQDQLFKYGVRVNYDYIQDIISGATPVVVGNIGDQAQVQVLPWPFYPIINNFSDHIITKNLNAVYTRFTGTIDTVKAEGISKTPLMFTSEYSRVLTAPVIVDLNALKEKPDPSLFNKKNIPVAYLLEGQFTSLYKNRPLPGDVNKADFKTDGLPSKIIVISDGDVIRNDRSNIDGRPLQLGFEQYSKNSFGNLDFLLNAVNYLTDDDGLINARAKVVRLRLLDKVRVARERTKWQVVNITIPILLILCYGTIKFYLRRRRYTRF